MMRLLRVSLVGGSAPKPPGFFRFFSARMGAFVLWSWGAAVVLPPRPVPAAAPVARVASQQSPIPSDGGRLIINPSARALNEKAANGDSPLNFVSHAWGSPQPLLPSPASSCPFFHNFPTPVFTMRQYSQPSPTNCYPCRRAKVFPVSPAGQGTVRWNAFANGRLCPVQSPGPTPLWLNTSILLM